MRKNSKSLRKPSPSKITKKKDCVKKCERKQISTLNIQHSLSRKYSNTQNFHYIESLNKFLKEEDHIKKTQQTQHRECCQKYYKTLNRKHIFPRIKEVYKLHNDIPRIFQPKVKDILNKCYHRKRLLDYFKIAKVLGIKVESVKFSSFLLSLNENTNKKHQESKKFDPIITKISTIDFSTQFERNLLEQFEIHEKQSALSNKQNWISGSNQESYS